jgi:YggT family protein
MVTVGALLPRSAAPVMADFLVPVFYVLIEALEVYKWIIIFAALMSWLIAFNVINTRNRGVAIIGDFLYRITEPALRPIRRLLPNLGGIDISPIIVFFIIILLQGWLAAIARRLY